MAARLQYPFGMLNAPEPIPENFDLAEQFVVYPGNCLDLLRECPDGLFQLIVTSPPYNIGKGR